MQSDPSSVRILRPSAKVSPEPIAPTLVSEPGVTAKCVFGVALRTLREDGQMVCGIPLVLRDMVEYLDKNGNLLFCDSSASLSFIYILYTSFSLSLLSLFLSLSQCNAILKHHRYVLS